MNSDVSKSVAQRPKRFPEPSSKLARRNVRDSKGKPERLPPELLLYSPAEVASILCKSRESIVTLINNRELEASNVGSQKRAQWKISQAALIDFLKRRSNHQLGAVPGTRTRRTRAERVNPYF